MKVSIIKLCISQELFLDIINIWHGRLGKEGSVPIVW